MISKISMGLAIFSLLVASPVRANPSLDIVAVPGIGSGLTLHGEGSTALEIRKVATVTVSTLSLLGYTLTVSSGAIQKPLGGPDIPYQILAVNAGAPQPQSSDFTVSSGNNFARCSLTPLTLDVYIKYTPAVLQDPGNYNATINLEAKNNLIPLACLL